MPTVSNTHMASEVCTKLLGTVECLRIGARLSAWENEFFGPDFRWTLDCAETWLRSGSMFCAAICEAGPEGQGDILGIVSLMITGTQSCERLLKGEIFESELKQWFLESRGSSPIFYFASVASKSAGYLPALYRRLFMDVERYVKAMHMRVHTGLAIASSSAGLAHLKRNGFVPAEGMKYLQKYDFLSIDSFTAQTEFWSRLLAPIACDPRMGREVEDNLRLSKLKQYLQLFPCKEPALR